MVVKGNRTHSGYFHLITISRYSTDNGRYVHPSNGLNQNDNRGAKIGARITLQKGTCEETEVIHTCIFEMDRRI